MSQKLKRFIAVVTVDDPDDNLASISDAALWLESSLSGGLTHCVSLYGKALDAVVAEKVEEGDFSIPAQPLSPS